MKVLLILAATLAVAGPAGARGSGHGMGGRAAASAAGHPGSLVGGRPATIVKAPAAPGTAGQAPAPHAGTSGGQAGATAGGAGTRSVD